ncbi:hypothetical protein DFQ28_000561 [Apophysomyces sp. BC1034]|nr:hypothetical protein DFQ28_000561 [Apophysomyces sp. BC1034]
MALKSTIYKAELQIADMDRHYYADHPLTIARHPSETDERMMARLLAFVLYAHERLEFCKGLSDTDEPDLWQKDLTGAIERWIEVGQPDERRIAKASSRAGDVVVLAYAGRPSRIWWEQVRGKVERLRNVTVLSLADSVADALAALAERTMRLQCTIQDGDAWPRWSAGGPPDGGPWQRGTAQLLAWRLVRDAVDLNLAIDHHAGDDARARRRMLAEIFAEYLVERCEVAREINRTRRRSRPAARAARVNRATGFGRPRRRHDRIRHFASVPDVRQVAQHPGRRRRVQRGRDRRNVLLGIRAAAHARSTASLDGRYGASLGVSPPSTLRDAVLHVLERPLKRVQRVAGQLTERTRQERIATRQPEFDRMAPRVGQHDIGQPVVPLVGSASDPADALELLQLPG